MWRTGIFTLILLYFCMNNIKSLVVNPPKLVKRKILLLGGYVGTNYYGVQMAKLQSQNGHLPTIENELRLALFEGGYITESNSFDLSKISWSRSSRTDKGVHAGRIAFAAKLELPETILKPKKNAYAPDYQSLPEVVSATNNLLPPQIRLFSCIRVPGGFNARSAGYWRAYEYLMPLEILKQSDKNYVEEEKLIERLNHFLAQFVGTHSFHNFHRIPNKTLKRKKTKDLSPRKQRISSKEELESIKPSMIAQPVPLDVADDDDGDDEDIDDEDEEAFKEEPLSVPEMRTSWYENWRETPRPGSEKTRGCIYRCEAEIIQDKSSSTKFVKVLIMGQSFYLHQIRLMMSAAILSVREMVPEFFIPLALRNEIFYHLPLAAPNGLFLTYTGFQADRSEDMIICPGARQSRDDINICTDEEYEKSEEFIKTMIYPRIFQDWTENDQFLLQDWLQCAERFRIPNSLVGSLRDSFDNLPTENVTMIKREKDLERIQRNLRLITLDIGNTQPKGNRKKRWLSADLLPQTLPSQLIVEFRILPGTLVRQIMNALGTKILNEEIPFSSSLQEYFQYLQTQIDLIHLPGKVGTSKQTLPKGLVNMDNQEKLALWASTQKVHPIFTTY